jgi:hypothetical protein
MVVRSSDSSISFDGNAQTDVDSDDDEDDEIDTDSDDESYVAGKGTDGDTGQIICFDDLQDRLTSIKLQMDMTRSGVAAAMMMIVTTPMTMTAEIRELITETIVMMR